VGSRLLGDIVSASFEVSHFGARVEEQFLPLAVDRASTFLCPQFVCRSTSSALFVSGGLTGHPAFAFPDGQETAPVPVAGFPAALSRDVFR
jgi:hypothetical protein